MSLTPEETWDGAPKDAQPKKEQAQPQSSASPPAALAPGRAPSYSPYPPPNPAQAYTPKSLATAAQATWIIFLLCALIGLLAWNTFRPLTKWEYKIEAVPDLSFDSDMERLGKEGWELVFARRASSSTDIGEKATFSYEMIFKRPSR